MAEKQGNYEPTVAKFLYSNASLQQRSKRVTYYHEHLLETPQKCGSKVPFD